MINKDTLTCLKDTEIKLINKIVASEKFYHSMYDNHSKKIASLEKQISVLDMIANDYKVSFEAKSSQYESLNMKYDLKAKDGFIMESDVLLIMGNEKEG